MPQRAFDVCVIGGGPAGAVSALRLAQLGHSVCLAERYAFPRAHVGESLTAGVLPVLDVLGIRAFLAEVGSHVTSGSLIRWSQPRTERVTANHRPIGWLVDRGEFDSVLLRAAASAGVQVLQPATVRDATGAGLRWRLEVATGGRTDQIEAAFIVDASGRKRWLPASSQGSNAGASATVAICGNLRVPGARSETLVEALKEGWCWGAPLPHDRFSAMIFLDQERLRRVKTVGTLEKFWRDELEKTELFKPINRAPLLGPVFGSDARIYETKDCIGPNWIRVGEASFTLDPLSSSGVEKAMQSGLHAATALHTLLLRPEKQELCAQFYSARQRETVSKHSNWACEAYQAVERYASEPFWRTRAGTSKQAPSVRAQEIDLDAEWPVISAARVRISDAVSLVEEPCVVDDEIQAQMAICHPSLERPVAFLNRTPIAELLQPARESQDLEALVGLWSKRMPARAARRIAAWMLTHQILTSTPRSMTTE